MSDLQDIKAAFKGYESAYKQIMRMEISDQNVDWVIDEVEEAFNGLKETINEILKKDLR